MDAYIKGISYYLPKKVMTNEELVKEFPEWSVEKVASKLGINQRHISAKDETAGDMAVSAAEMIFNEYKIAPSDIDFIILCTQSPDYFLPTTACVIQDKLGIPTSVGALDINLGCSGFVYGLALAKGLVSGCLAKNILLLTSETYNKHIHTRDKGNRTIFGDASAATLISTEGFALVENFSFGTDGKGAENLMIKTGGLRHPNKANDLKIDKTDSVYSSDHLYMSGSEIFNFTLNNVPLLVENTLKANNITEDKIDLFVYHQANKYMLNTLRKLSGIDHDKFYLCLENFGNTVSSTIPIALKEAQKDKSIQKGNKVLIAGFGVGYSWAGGTIQF